MDLGFHPNEIYEEKEETGSVIYYFSIPAKEHEKFIDEIGSFKPRHIRIFEEHRSNG